MKRIHSHAHKVGKIRLVFFLARFNKCQKCRLFDEPEQLEKRSEIPNTYSIDHTRVQLRKPTI